MKKIRKNSFETNSSSSHSVFVDDSVDIYDETLSPSANGEIRLYYGEYGWEWKELDTPFEKACYAITEYPEEAKRVIEEFTGHKVVVEKTGCSYYPQGYIDHQSNGTLSVDDIKDVIFKSGSLIFTGNDNDDAPEGFYENVKKNYKLSVGSESFLLCGINKNNFRFEFSDEDQHLNYMTGNLSRVFSFDLRWMDENPFSRIVKYLEAVGDEKLIKAFSENGFFEDDSNEVLKSELVQVSYSEGEVKLGENSCMASFTKISEEQSDRFSDINKDTPWGEREALRESFFKDSKNFEKRIDIKLNFNFEKIENSI